MNQHMNFRSSVLLLLVAGTAVPAYGDDLPDKVPAQLRDRALSTLRNGLKTETKWVKVHAAEALIWHGYPDDIGTMFAAEAATADPQYRIGCLRVLAQAAMVPEDREQRVQQIRQELANPESIARVHAIETLAKLGFTPGEEDRLERGLAAEPPSAMTAYARWAMANSARKTDMRSLAQLLDSSDKDIRATAAYALRHLSMVPEDVAGRIASVARREADESPPNAYVMGAWYVHAGEQDRADAARALLPLAKSESKDQRYEVCATLGRAGSLSNLDLLETMLDDEQVDVRIAAAHAILRIGRRFPH